MEKIHPVTQRLPNGLLAHHYPRPGEVIGLGVAVSVGGWHDPVGKEGLAHLLEHVLFCGSRHWSENRVQVELERRAALRNGMTSEEYTFYWIALPAADLEFGLKYLRQLVFEPRYPPALIEREQKRIDSEALRYHPKPDWAWPFEQWLMNWSIKAEQMFQALAQFLTQGSGRGRRVIGFRKTRRAIRLDDLRHFHQTHYTPDRTAILMLGESNQSSFGALVEHYFGDLKPSSQPSATFPDYPTQPTLGRRHLLRNENPLEAESLGIGYLFPSLTAEQLPAAYVLHQVILDELVNQMDPTLAYRFVSTLWSRRNHSVFLMGFQVHWLNMASFRMKVLNLLERIHQGEIEEHRFECARQSSQNSWSMSMESTYRYLEWLAGEPLIFTETPPVMSPAIEKVELEMIRRLATSMLAPKNRLILAHQPIWLWLPLAGIATFGPVCVIFYLIGQLSLLLERLW